MEVLEKVLSFLASAEGAATTIAIVLEFAFRMIPTKKPLGILHLVAKFSHVIGKIFSGFGALLDKVLPQNVVVVEEKKD